MSKQSLLSDQIKTQRTTVLSQTSFSDMSANDPGRSRLSQNKIISAVCVFIFSLLHIQSLKNEREALNNLRRSMIAVEKAVTNNGSSAFSIPEHVLVEERIVQEEQAAASPASPAPTSIPIFYNLFIEKLSDVPRVSNFVRDQLLDYLKPGIHGPILINSIGVVDDLRKLFWPPSLNATLMNHYEKGDEVDTLQELWSYCSREDTHPEQKVVYLHSKGSFHWHEANEQLRVYLTKGALSEECSNLPDTCNVCSSRMSPMPHPHTSGNMWLSRCEYVRKLIEPKQFIRAMFATNRELRNKESGCMGTGRFALEHCEFIASVNILSNV